MIDNLKLKRQIINHTFLSHYIVIAFSHFFLIFPLILLSWNQINSFKE